MNRSPMPRPSKPMPKMSAKRRAELGGNPSSTFAPKRPQLKTSAMKKPRVSTGPDRLTVDAVLERDQYSCAWCGGGLWGERGRDWSIQHRRPRRNGGDPRPDTNSPANLVPVHGDGTTLCHGFMESQRTVAYAAGFLLHADAKPREHQIKHAIHGWCLLTDKAGVRRLSDDERGW